jgi:hypothetical protein
MSSTAVPKKKFGKNLNKLVQATTAPPIVNRSADRGSVRNGLLLLSTKKSGGGLLANKNNNNSNNNNPVPKASGTDAAPATSASAAPVAHTNSKPKAHLSYEVSTHDVLLSAIGASQAEASLPPDAWGVHQQKSPQKPHEAPADNHTVTPLAAESLTLPKSTAASEPVRDVTDPAPPVSTMWDAYGGRGGTPAAAAVASDSIGVQQSSEEDLQANTMARLAKERAEKRRMEEEERFVAQREAANERLRALEQRQQQRAALAPTTSERPSVTTVGPPRTLWEPERENAKRETATDTDTAEPTLQEPKIHLVSYEDRDRGERNTDSGPRMLYDPKSGSMVAVKAPRKERTTKKGHKASDSGSENAKSTRKPKTKKEGNKVTLATKPESAKANPNRKLPRTCGVLYARGAKGKYYCVDGCEADFGYGSHSVPGGRIRNPQAYANLMKKQMLKRDDPFEGYGDDGFDIENYGVNVDHQKVPLSNGFSIDDEQPQPVEWITADDKIELVTGADESPTLKPTAKEWAPNQAALAAASKNKADSSVESMEDTDDLEEEDDDDVQILGLGFDPTQDMDFVMHSPSHTAESRATSRLAGVGLEDLSLDPPMLSSTVNSTEPRSHIFAFGSSGTWGAGKIGSRHDDDWTVPTIGSGGGLFGTDVFRSGETSSNQSSPFLTIPANSSWGSSIVRGFGGVPSNGDKSSSPAD